MALSSTERVRKFRERRKKEGGKLYTVWLPASLVAVVEGKAKRRKVRVSTILLDSIKNGIGK